MRVTDEGEILWSGRLEKALLKRLYEADAAGIPDEGLLDEAGWALYARCKDILYLFDFLNGAFRCPRCEAAEGRGPEMAAAGEGHKCPVCGFSMPMGAMRESFRKKQLNPGGAVPAFEKYTADWEKASTVQQKMLAIDAVIHSFHYSLKAMPDMPTRAAGVNLIEGRLGDVEAFLDQLSADGTFKTELARSHSLWKNQPSQIRDSSPQG